MNEIGFPSVDAKSVLQRLVESSLPEAHPSRNTHTQRNIGILDVVVQQKMICFESLEIRKQT